jgi:hypothetical protein
LGIFGDRKAMKEKNKPEILKIVLAIFSIILPIILSVGGYFFFTGDDSWKGILGNISILLYILPFCLIIAAITKVFFPDVFSKLDSYILIFLLSIIGVLTSYSTLLIINNRDLLTDSDAYISTRIVEEIQKLPSPTSDALASLINQSSLACPTDIPDPESVENGIIEFVNLVNSKLILGLSNSKKYEEDIYSYFCKSTPSAQDQIEVFYRGIMRKYCGYGISTFSLPAEYESIAIIQEPLEINDGEYVFSQIEHWEYTIYSGEKNERIDISEKLYEYTILEIEDGLYCISSYTYKDPPEDYYLGLETQ